MFLAAHSGIRYLVFLTGLAVIAYGLYGLLGKKEYTDTMGRLSSAFTGLVDLQILTGVAVMFSRPFGTQLIGHLLMTALAALVAHGVGSVMRKRPPEAKTYAPHVIGTTLALALIVGGIMAIGRGVFQSTI